MDRADAEMQQPEFFARYLKEAAKWLSVVDLKHRGAAIELSKHPLDTLDGVAMVKTLCATLDGPWWQDRANSRGRNWMWRAQTPTSDGVKGGCARATAGSTLCRALDLSNVHKLWTAPRRS